MPAETGHHPNTVYREQGTGALHTTGTTIYDGNDVVVVPSGANGLAGQTICRVLYDFAVDGGAIGLITPATAVALPAKAIITMAYTQVLTQLTGAGATVAFGIVTTNDLLTATAIGTMGTIGFHALIPVDTAATFVQATLATQKLTMTVATGALTAGKMAIFLEYVVGL